MIWEIKVTNPNGGQPGVIPIGRPKLDLYPYDRPDHAVIRCTTDTPISKYADLDIYWKGSLRFRGVVVDTETSSDGVQVIDCFSREWLLKKRMSAWSHQFLPGVTVSEMLGDSLGASEVGYLAMARSLVLQGDSRISVYSGATYKLSGGGTAGRFGSGAVYCGTTQLTLGSDKDALTAGQYWRDATDLYFRLPDDADPDYEMLLVGDWKDPGIRLGDVSDIGSLDFPAPIRFRTTNIYKKILSLVQSCGARIRWRHDIDDGLTYLDAFTSDYGRGTSSAGIRRFVEPDVEITQVPVDDVEVHGLIALGAGEDKFQTIYSLSDLASQGRWVEDIYSDSNLYEGIIDGTAATVYATRQITACHEIIGPSIYELDVEDYVDLLKLKHSTITDKIQAISHGEDGKMKIYTGRRPKDEIDLFEAQSNFVAEQTSTIERYLQMWSDSWRGNVTDDVNGVWEVEMPEEEVDTEYGQVQILLGFTIGWFQSNVTDVTTKQHNHGNAGSGGHSSHGNAGSGGASSHGNAGSGGYLTHGATSKASADDVTVIDAYFTISGSTSTVAVGSVSGIYYYTPRYGYSIGSSSSYCAACGFGVVTSVGLNTTSKEFVTDLNSSAKYPAANGHGHAKSGTYWTASQYTHYHSIDVNDHSKHSDHSVTDNPAHTDHSVSDNPAHTDHAVPDKIASEDDVTHRLVELSTGSLVYLTVKVYVNGTLVSGGTFEDVFVGDSFNGINVTDLFDLDGSNTVTFEIVGYDPPGDPCRCEINASLNAKLAYVSI